jgi:hypothetical protein
MAVFHGPITVQMGSPEGELDRDRDETQVTRTINRDFAIATTEVTIDEFIRLIPDYRHKDLLVNPTGDCPAVMMTWYRAAEYCYWLSLEEDVPEEEMCYALKDGVVMPVNDYLHRNGYRMPTEAEWELACRAGSDQPYSWGNSLEIGDRFSWTAENSAGHNHPAGSLCPNRLGLFDMHGSVGEWLIDIYHPDRRSFSSDNQPDDEMSFPVPEVEKGIIKENFETVLHGGSVFTIRQKARIAARTPGLPYNGNAAGLGLRIARTVSVD